MAYNGTSAELKWVVSTKTVVNLNYRGGRGHREKWRDTKDILEEKKMTEPDYKLDMEAERNSSVESNT